MSVARLFVPALVAWFVIVTAGLVSRVVLAGQELRALELSAWVFMACAPPAIAYVLSRGRSTQSIGQVIYDAEHRSTQQARVPVDTDRR